MEETVYKSHSIKNLFSAYTDPILCDGWDGTRAFKSASALSLVPDKTALLMPERLKAAVTSQILQPAKPCPNSLHSTPLEEKEWENASFAASPADLQEERVCASILIIILQDPFIPSTQVSAEMLPHLRETLLDHDIRTRAPLLHVTLYLPTLLFQS